MARITRKLPPTIRDRPRVEHTPTLFRTRHFSTADGSFEPPARLVYCVLLPSSLVIRENRLALRSAVFNEGRGTKDEKCPYNRYPCFNSALKCRETRAIGASLLSARIPASDTTHDTPG
jgi:hypothetical protein